MSFIHDVDDDEDKRLATERVEQSAELSPYKDIIIDYDWEDPFHYGWVNTALTSDILEWAKGIRKDEEAQVDQATQ